MLNETSAFSNKKVISIYDTPQSTQIDLPSCVFERKINKRLRELVRLPKGWDGYNANPVSHENACFAQQILNQLCDGDTPQPQIVPGVNGDLQIEWHTYAGSIELHIIKPYHVLFWTDDDTICSEDNEKLLSTDFTDVMMQLRKHTRKLMEQQNVRANSGG